MSSDYEFVLTGPCTRALLAKSPACRRRTLSLLDSLATDPFKTPDFHETGPSGRSYAVYIDHAIIVTCWVDHPAKEVRVIQIEWL